MKNTLLLAICYIIKINFLLASVASLGNVNFDVGRDGVQEMQLNSDQLQLGSGNVSIGLNGHMGLSKAISIGDPASTSSNLSLGGTWSCKPIVIASPSDNRTLDRSSLYLVDNENCGGNIITFLPSAVQCEGRMLTVKKKSRAHTLHIQPVAGESIEGRKNLMLGEENVDVVGGYANLFASGGNWYVSNASSGNFGMMSANLVGYWSFDQSSYMGNAVVDHSGRGNHGAYVSSSALTSKLDKGVSGNGLIIEYDGSLGYHSHVRVPHSSSIDNDMGDMTLMFWYKPSNVTAEHIFFEKKFADGSVGGYGFKSKNTAEMVVYRGAKNDSKFSTTGQNIAASAWNHCALTFSGTTLQVYLNGVQVYSGTNFKTFTATDGDLFLGIAGNLANGAVGTIDECLIYNRALSATEIAQNYSAK
jgi:hypothetical protein